MKNNKLNDLIANQDLTEFCEWDGEIYYDAKASHGFAEYAQWDSRRQEQFDKGFANTYKASKSGRHIRVLPSLQKDSFKMYDVNGNAFFGRPTTYDKQLSYKDSYGSQIKIADYISTACTFLVTIPECAEHYQLDHKIRRIDCDSEYAYNEAKNLSWKTSAEHLNKTRMENSNPQNKGTKNPTKAKEILLQIQSIISICFDEDNIITQSLSFSEKKKYALERMSKVEELVS